MNIQRLKVTLMMVVAKFGSAVLTISYKLAQKDGMHMKVLITYRYLFASILIFPLAFFLERNKRPKLTWRIFFQVFLCAIFGGPLAQNMYAKSIILTSPTFTTAFTNLIPPFTFVLAVIFRLEKVEIGKITGKAKIIGTLIGVGGAMILTLYKGNQLNIGSTHFNILHGGQHIGHAVATHKTSNHIFGSLLAFIYSLSVALYYILQSKLSVNYPCHFSNTCLFSMVGFILSLLHVVVTEKSLSECKLGSKIRILSTILQGISSLVAVCLGIVVVRLQGPLFVSVFSPLVLIFVAIAGFLVLDEKLYMGSLLGSVTVIAGLYLVLWGKSKDTKRLSKLTISESSKEVKVVSNTEANMTVPEIAPMARGSFSVNVNEGVELPAKSSRDKHAEEDIVEEV